MKKLVIGAGETMVAAWQQDVAGTKTDVCQLHAGATAARPTYATVPKGTLFFDTTLGKLNVAGATDWEVVSSA